MEFSAIRALFIGPSGVDPPRHWTVDHAGTGSEGIDRFTTSNYDVVLLTAPGPDLAVADLIEQLLSLRRSVPIVVCDPSAQVADAVRYMQCGAYDVAGPEDNPVAKIELAAEACSRKSAAATEPWREMLIGTSPAMQRTADIIRLVASRRSTVLINGETGTGKEVVARALHLASPRAHLPMISVNIAALPPSLLETELLAT